MLPKEYRIKRKRFGVVLKKGRKLRFNGYSLIFIGNSAGHPRISLVIKKGVIKSAVKRNLARRKILGLFEKEIKGLSRPVDVIILIYRPVKNQNDTEGLRAEILKLIR